MKRLYSRLMHSCCDRSDSSYFVAPVMQRKDGSFGARDSIQVTTHNKRLVLGFGGRSNGRLTAQASK